MGEVAQGPDPFGSPSAAAPPSVASRLWSVAALVQAVSDHLAVRFARCQVRGELSGFTQAASGHCYFTLKDDDGSASLRCAMFRRAAAALNTKPQNGWRVEVSGELSVYGARGELQLVVESMRPAGTGSWYEEFLRLKAKLEAEGLFDAARKRALNAHPQCVGVVTSLQAAALHDVLSVFARRSPHVALVIYPCAVQGGQAPAQLCQAIATAGERREADTLIVCRGGGSMEDLLAFNHEAVVRAIAQCPIPVISAVGHETDVTLADFAADLRAPTPSAAAELAARPQTLGLQTLAVLQRRMQRSARQRLDARAQGLDTLSLRLNRPQQWLARQEQALAGWAQRLHAAMPYSLQTQERALQRLAGRLRWAQERCDLARAHRLEALSARLLALDPQRVLRRGFAWLSDEQGQAIASVGQLTVGQAFAAQLADGRVEGQVSRLLTARPGAKTSLPDDGA